ncbi:MAG: SdrD B-like domain-containing protein [Ferruginibacter sp.]
MNRSKCILYITIAVAVAIFSNTAGFSQSYKNFSSFAGGSDVDNVTVMKVDNGETYVVGTTLSANFPVTNGSTYKGNGDLTITKYSTNGTVLYATYLGGRGNETLTAWQEINGEVFLTGYTDSINFPVTNGSVFHGGRDAFVTKLTTTGAIAFSTYLGGSGGDAPTGALQINGNEILVTGNTSSINFPVTNGSVYQGGVSDIFVTKLNATDGSIILSAMFGGDKQDFLYRTAFENGNIYLAGTTFSTNIPVTIGSYNNDAAENGFIIKVNGADFSTSYARYLGGTKGDFLTTCKVVNGILNVAGYTYSLNFPTTNGSTTSGLLGDYVDGYYTRLDTDGNILFSTYLATIDLDFIDNMIISNNDIYLTGTVRSTTPGDLYARIFKLNTSGSFIYQKKFSLGFNTPNAISYEVFNGDLYFSGTTSSVDFTVNNGSQFYGPSSGFFTHLDPNGNVIYSTFLGKMNSILPMKISNNKFYLLGNTDLSSFPVTDQSVISGGNDNILIIKNNDGTDFFSGYVGGSSNDLAAALQVDGDAAFFAGKTSSVDYPVTNNVLYKANIDQFVTNVSFCPNNYFYANDTLSPKIQTACKFGLGQKITGIDISVPSDSLPPIHLNGTIVPQAPIEAVYQWQSANAATGPWTNIANAIFKDYTPVLGPSDRYYRRLAFTFFECGSVLIHTSDTAIVIANLLTAPTINTNGPFITCPGSPVTIGGSPTATGGNPPYTNYSWDMGAAPVANPTVTPNVNTIFTLVVTDAMGCQQVGQSIVLTYRADAGPDKSACGGNAVQIGGSPIPGLPGVVYAWQPPTGLTATDISQPFANPVIITDYELTLTVPKSGGGTCTTKDTVKVTPVAAPVTANIAGPDKVVCFMDSAFVGANPEAGFTYVWSPGSYLTSNTHSTAYYYSGNIVMPVPNPAVLHVTAQKDGCSFPDETIVSTIEARAGLDGCGPRIIGMPDRTPNINETYAWTIISGPGGFVGPTNLPQVAVTASVGAPTVYGLTVTYNGWTCSDQVTVPDFCINCDVIITVDAQYACASFDVNGGDVSLIAHSGNPNAVFSWEPQVGLTNYLGSVTHLVDNVPRVYTVTATDANDTSIHCVYSIFVNNPAFSKPVFPANDTVTCAGQPVTIGAAPVAGYIYQWTGSGLSSNLISNPVATILTQTLYPIKITDANGCQLTDSVLVRVENVQVNAGADWIICSSGIITLGGTIAQPNTSYLWEPQASPWQNGTNQFSAQPQVFIATNVDFILTGTTTAGCISKDTVHVVIDNTPDLPAAPDKFTCKGIPVLIGNPAIPGVTYQWSPTTGLNNATIAQPLANPAVTTTYSVIATFPGSCGSTGSDDVTVTVGNAFFSMPDITFCPVNGPFALGNAAPPNMTAYNWQPQQLVTDHLIANPSTLNPPPGTTTQFTLQVTNADGCQYRDTILIIPATTAPNAGPDKTICKDQTTTIGSAANVTGPGISYSWSPITNLSDPTSPNPVFTGTVGGIFSYTLTKTDNNFSCTITDIVIIRVIDSLLPTMNPQTICQNSCVQIGTTPIPGLQYEWTPATGLSNPNIANPILCIDSVAATYLLSVTDLVHACTVSANVVIGVLPLPAAQISIPDVIACLGDSDVIFNPIITPPGNYSYIWSPNNGTLNNIYILTPEVTTMNSGTTLYTLQITDNVTKCRNTDVGNLIVNICPTLSVVGDYVWYDTNGDGLQDANELGVSGMKVDLYNSVSFHVGSRVTDTNGYYLFTDVDPGTGYYITFTKPDGFIFTTRFVGGINAINNSKADSAGRSNDFNVPPGTSVLNVDAGLKVCGNVPVTLLGFNAVLHNREVLTNWQTTAEYNNDYFIVERSNDAIHFIPIGQVDGNGTTSIPHNYSLIDPHPFTGINYYRLRQVDFDGHYTYSNVVAINLNNDEIATAYYNNLNNSIQVIFNGQQDNVYIKLYADNGQLVKSISTANNITSYTLQLPPLSSGVYMLQVMNKNIRFAKKIFVRRSN